MRDRQTGDFLSIAGVQVFAAIDGPFARTALVLAFENHLDRVLEADLDLPAARRGAERALSIRLGGRQIEGKIRPRARAQAEYRRAVEAGQSAALGRDRGRGPGPRARGPGRAGRARRGDPGAAPPARPHRQRPPAALAAHVHAALRREAGRAVEHGAGCCREAASSGPWRPGPRSRCGCCGAEGERSACAAPRTRQRSRSRTSNC